MKSTQLSPSLQFSSGTDALYQSETETKGIAVLELFTSEGCSSCPPADELMGKIQQEFEGGQVYILSYHVDYWDSLGWKDVFGHAGFTKRQYSYADLFRLPSVYTPQVVVNGQREYVASMETTVRNAIKKVLAIPAGAEIKLKTKITGQQLEVGHSVTGASGNSQLLLAIVEKSAKSIVGQGENADRTLSHYQIVHHLQSTLLGTDEKDHITMQLPWRFDTGNFELIGFVQDLENGTIMGATKVRL